MKNLIKVYRWENGKILEKEIAKSELKHTLGWRSEPDEAIFSQLENKRYALEDKIFVLKKSIDDVLLLEDSIVNLKVDVPAIPKENAFGLSTKSIDELIDKLNMLKENSK